MVTAHTAELACGELAGQRTAALQIRYPLARGYCERTARSNRIWYLVSGQACWLMQKID